ncbi:MAG TPA: DUF6391 domain-containing protein [Anaerolineaceae bacterium]|nr:DUF6391 domain-containing protein [Anaerolineaceae bacterium]HPN51218.1 DUF6391 domain-containing protein [Anaerolineaceae bacterium]
MNPLNWLLDTWMAVRRNHGLEHATLNILGRRFPGIVIAGHSDRDGCWIIGSIPSDALAQAAYEALSRLKSGEHGLVIHRNCGTNFVASGAAAGLAAWLGMFNVGRSFRQKLERLPTVIMLSTLALIISQPLGPYLQQVATTTGEVTGLTIQSIRPAQRGGLPAHRITTTFR